MIRQLTNGEESAAGFFEGIVHPLHQGAGVRAERIIRAPSGQRGEDGFPDRLTTWGEPTAQQPGGIGQPVQVHSPVRLLQPLLLRARAVRVQVGQNPLT